MNTSTASAKKERAQERAVARAASWLESHGLLTAAGSIDRPEEECVEWERLSSHRYGYIHSGEVAFRAHRVVYAASRGMNLSELDGLVVRHTCDNPSCCNPRHLILGSVADNVRDSMDRGRKPIGERHPMAKLTAAQVADIRTRHVSGKNTSELGKEFNVSARAIWLITTNRTWREQ